MGDIAFRAGRMVLNGSQLVADARKGLVQVVKKEDGSLHLTWRNRVGAAPSGAAELDVVLPPSQSRCEKVQRPNSRILAVHRAGADGHFFWLQEPAAFDDDALVTRLSQQLAAESSSGQAKQLAPAQPPAAQQQPPTAPPQGLPSAPVPSAAPSAAAAAQSPSFGSGTSAGGGMSYRQAVGQSGRIDAAQLAAVLRGLTGSRPLPAMSGAGIDHQAALRQQMEQMQAMQRVAEAGPSLSEVLTPDDTVPLACTEGVLERLAPHLPEEHQSQEQLIATLQSPQFRRVLDVFNAALVSGRLDLRHFGLDPKGFSVADFLESIQAAAERAAREGANQS